MYIIFYLPAVLFFVSGLPQMIKLVKTKSSEDISVLMYLLTCTAIVIIVIDAYLAKDMSILISNLASLAVAGTNTILVIKYKKKKPKTIKIDINL
jgi:MtN3 and saliva related transmembrane protein